MQGADHQVTGNRSLHGDHSRLGITDLTDHNNIGVLTQNGTERICEGHIGFGIDLHLIDAVNIRLHGILYGDDVGAFFIQLAQRCIKRGGFTATRRTGDQNDAVRMSKQMIKSLELRVGKAEKLFISCKVLLNL